MTSRTSLSSYLLYTLLTIGDSSVQATKAPPFMRKENDTAPNMKGAKPRTASILEMKNDLLHKSEIPNTGGEWMSINPETEFQINTDAFNTGNPEEDEKRRNTLQRLLEGNDDDIPTANDAYSNPYKDQAAFVEGSGTYYSGYAQAWRYVGYYVDCEYGYGNNNNKDRKLNDNDNDSGCSRYLLWGAYVNPNYGGNGLYEYQFYNRWDDEWTSYCKNNNYCTKLDCHQQDTSFQLLGFFKHADYDDWFEQLFKHEGYCIWTEDESDFMYGNENFVPVGCNQLGARDEDYNYLHYALMPLSNGDVTLGLYTDSRCLQVYGGEMDVWDTLGAYYEGSGSGDGNNLQESFETWNSAFDIYKQCQPCVAYNLDNGFECEDLAGYQNVNQCMKFATKCEMETATLSTVSKALKQGATTGVNLLSGTSLSGIYNSQSSNSASSSSSNKPDVKIIVYETNMALNLTLVSCALAFFVFAAKMLLDSFATNDLEAKRYSPRKRRPLKEPLVSKGDGQMA